MNTRAHVVATAKEWLGTRWLHQASLKGVGTDCIGLIAGVAAECGVAEADKWAHDPHRQNYGREPDHKMLLAACDAYLDRIAFAAAVPGDVLLFRFAAEPQHFGILSRRAPDYVIHAYAQARKVVENRLDELWRSRLVAVYRLRGLDG